jgi:phage gp16-like protein
MISKQQLSVVHVAKARLGLCDDDYRALLKQAAGVESARDLDAWGFARIMEAFERLGFQSTFASRNLGNRRAGMASPAQVALMRSLWREGGYGEGDDRSLDRYLDHHFHVSSVRFVDAARAPKIIAGLKNMARRSRAGNGRAPETPAA